MTETLWKCDGCGKERESAVPGLVTTYPPSKKMSQPCECGGQYWLETFWLCENNHKNYTMDARFCLWCNSERVD